MGNGVNNQGMVPDGVASGVGTDVGSGVANRDGRGVDSAVAARYGKGVASAALSCSALRAGA